MKRYQEELQRRITVARMLRVYEHRAPIRRYGDAGDFITCNAREQPAKFAGAGVGNEHLIVQAVFLTAIRLDKQASIRIRPESVRIAEAVLGAIVSFPSVRTVSILETVTSRNNGSHLFEEFFVYFLPVQDFFVTAPDVVSDH